MLNEDQQIKRQIEKASHIAIILPEAADGDIFGAAVALQLFLKKADRDSEIISAQVRPDEEPESLWSFLPNYSQIKNDLVNLRNFIVSLDIKQAKIGQIKYQLDENVLNFIISPREGWFTADNISTSASGFKYDLIITIGAPDLESLGKLYDNNIEFFYKTTIINIDHSTANEEFGQLNIVDVNMVSNAELIYNLLINYRPELLDADIATGLLAGLIYKTKNFKTANITPGTLVAVSKLIDLGARREDIINRLYRSKNFKTLKLWGQILEHLETKAEGALLWSELPASAAQNREISDDALIEIIDDLIIDLTEANLIIFFWEELGQDGPLTKIFVYSVKNINAKEVLENLKPTGSAKIAKAASAETLAEVVSAVLAEAEKKLLTVKNPIKTE
jgi:phosphoesterase RecJ-like protein